MIASIFKNNDRLLLFSLPLCAIIVTLISFWGGNEQVAADNSSILLPLLFHNLKAPWLLQLFNCFFLLIGALLIYYMNSKQELGEKQNFLPSFMYLLLGSTLNATSYLHPIVAANIPLLLMINSFVYTYRLEKAVSAIFDASFYLSLAALIYFPYIIFFPLPFIATFIFRTFNFREWLSILLGLLLPFLICGTILWLTEVKYIQWLSIGREMFSFFHFAKVWEMGIWINLTTVVLVILSLWGVLKNGWGNKVKSQKGKYFLAWFFVIGLFFSFLLSHSTAFAGALVLIPLSIFIGDYLGKLKKEFFADFWLIVLITAWIALVLR